MRFDPANFSWRSDSRVFLAVILLSMQAAAAAAHAEEGDTKRPWPDLYPYVASDILEWCKPAAGVWVDLGAGSGGVALAVASAENDAASRSTIILLDPDANAISGALRKGREKGFGNRLVAVVGVAEKMPLPDNSVDLVFSRGSVFFWDDQAQGIRQIHRVLRPGASKRVCPPARSRDLPAVGEGCGRC
jgi:SAM-dependent methyltransferase